MRLAEIVGLSVGGFGIFLLDMGFNGSSASDIFFPPQLRKIVPPALNITVPNSSPPQILAGYLPPGQNIYLYIIGGAFLGVGMLILILVNRNSRRDSRVGKIPGVQIQRFAMRTLAISTIVKRSGIWQKS